MRDAALAIFRGLRIAPTVTISPDGTLGFSFSGGFSSADVNATIEHLLSLPAQLGAERERRVALVFDEFQEIVKIHPHLIALMRSVFQEQAGVAHVYAGSRRHMMRQIFSDENEPFWRSAKQLEEALRRVLASENAHFARIWEDAPRVQRTLLEALARGYRIAEPFLGEWIVTRDL